MAWAQIYSSIAVSRTATPYAVLNQSPWPAARLATSGTATWLKLEESEDRLLKAFTEAASDQDMPATAREAVTRLLPEVRECHNLMRARKQAMKNAA